MTNYFPLMTSMVASIFTVLLVRQYLWRRKIHQLIWSIGICLYAIAAFMEFLMNPDMLGATAPTFQLYYLISAPLVGFLGAGVVYLLTKRVGHVFFIFVLALSVALIISSFVFPINEGQIASAFSGELASGFRNAFKAYPINVRIFSILINSIAGMVLIFGAAYSFIRDRRRTYNIWIAIGGSLPWIGGSAIALDSPDLFFVLELGGIICLFIGFYLSDRILREREKKMDEAKQKLPIWQSPVGDAGPGNV